MRVQCARAVLGRSPALRQPAWRVIRGGRRVLALGRPPLVVPLIGLLALGGPPRSDGLLLTRCAARKPSFPPRYAVSQAPERCRLGQTETAWMKRHESETGYLVKVKVNVRSNKVAK